METLTPNIMQHSKLLSLLLAAGLLTSGCQNAQPGENAAVFGGLGAAVTGIALGAAGVDPAITIPVTAGAGLVAGAGAYIISKSQANAQQRKIAEANAQAAVAKMEAQKKKAAASSSSRTAKSAAKPRFIAVDTVASKESPKGSSQVMVYDTKTNQIVGNNVYNIGEKPKVGSNTSYDTMTAQYVGTGRSL